MGNIDPQQETRYSVKADPAAGDPGVRPGLYRHWKGELYVVLGSGEMDGSRAPVVIYRPAYPKAGENVLTVRPLGDFLSRVNVQGAALPRFVMVSPFLDGAPVSQ
jgi:hypothetical protein